MEKKLDFFLSYAIFILAGREIKSPPLATIPGCSAAGVFFIKAIQIFLVKSQAICYI
jgi:hypothetical protein